MWSGPRNMSTAMMYAWRQRTDTTVWDEPLYGHYLAVSGTKHPGYQSLLETLPTDPDEIAREMLCGKCERPIRFYKNMAHHLGGFGPRLDKLESFLLTRDPREMLPSLAAGLGRVPTLTDTGYAFQSDLAWSMSATGAGPIVVDSKELLQDPRSVLTQLCSALDVEFTEAMLSWPSGPKPEDGAWASHWYGRLHETTGFEPYRPQTKPFPDELEPIYQECLPHYEQLAAFTLKANR